MPSNQSVDSAQDPAVRVMALTQHNFLMPLLIQLLSDRDVLTGLLLIGKFMKSSLSGYRVKSMIHANKLSLINQTDFYMPVILTRIRECSGDEELIKHASLQEVHYLTSFECKRRFKLNPLPSSVQSLIFGVQFGRTIPSSFFSASLRELHLPKRGSFGFGIQKIPNVKVLTMDSFDFLKLGDIPASVTELDVSNVTMLKAGALPPALERLTLSCTRRTLIPLHIMPGSLPSTLRYLHCHDRCRIGETLVRGVLPDSLTHLDLSTMYPTPMESGALPDSLTSLTICHPGKTTLIYEIPPSVTHLTSTIKHDAFPVDSIPSTVRSLEIAAVLEPGAIPEGVTHLVWNPWFKTPTFIAGCLPSSLQVLHLTGVCDIKIRPGDLPFGLKELLLGICHVNPLQVGSIPSSVELLTLQNSLAFVLSPGVIPTSVRTLHFGCSIKDWCIKLRSYDSDPCMKSFTSSLKPGDIPCSVTHLVLDGSFNQMLTPGCIPHSAIHLEFGDYYNQPFCVGTIPPSVKFLTLGHRFCQPFSPDSLPTSVRELYLYDRNCDVSNVSASITYLELPQFTISDNVSDWNDH